MAIDRDKLLQSAAKLIEKKKYDKAIVEYQRIVQHDPKDARTLLKIGDLYSRLKDFASAVATYERVASLYASQGFHLKAIAVYKQIREIIHKQAPELGTRYSHITPRLADIYAELNLVTDALAAYDEVATDYQRAGRDHDAIKVFQKTVALDPKNPLPHLRLAEARCRVRALDEAIDSFWTAAELLLGLRRPDDALKVIERILHFRQEPVYARAAAELYLRKGDPESGMLALARLQLAFQANPKDLDTLALLAQAFEVIQQPDKALAVHLEMARLAREQKRADLWHQIMAHLRQAAPHNDQVHALDLAGPPAVTQAPSGPPSVEVHLLDDEEAIDLDEEVEYLEERGPLSGGKHVSVASMRAAPRISQLPQSAHPPSSITRPSRPPSVTNPSLRGELMDAVEDDDDGIPVGESLRGEVHELRAPHSFQPSSHAHKAIHEASQFQNMGLLDKSVEVLHIALELDPNSIPIREKLREILVVAGEREPAIIETLNIAIIHIHNQNPNEAEPLALEVLEIEPGHPDALNILEHVRALREGAGAVRDDGALTSYDMEGVRPSDAISQLPPAPALPSFEAGSYSQHQPAVPSSRGAAKQSPAEGPRSSRRGRHRSASSQPAAAERTSPPRSRSAERPSNEAIEEVLEEAEFFASQGLFIDAIAILRDMLELAPEHPLLKERLAEVRALETKSDTYVDGVLEAPEDHAFDIAASLDALDELDEPETRPALASLEQEVDVDQVFAKFKEGVKAVVDDSDAATHYDLGLAYKEMALLEDACAEFELASNDPARAAMCFFMIGTIRKEQGQFDKAQQALRAGLDAEQLNADEQNGLEYELALLEQSAGHQPEYVRHLQNIAARDIGYRDVAARIRALGERVPEPLSEDADLDAAFNNLLG